MCNACGNYCCGSDEFGRCGCDGCPDPRCWPKEEERDDYDPMDCACGYCGPGALRCEAVDDQQTVPEAKPYPSLNPYESDGT